MTTKSELLNIIRQNCSECMGGERAVNNKWPVSNPSEIGGCPCEETCIFWKFRLGSDPEPNEVKAQRGRELAQARWDKENN